MIKRVLFFLLTSFLFITEFFGQCPTGFSLTLGPDQNYCPNTQVTLSAVATNAPSGSVTYSWSYQGNPIASNPSGSSYPIPINQAGSYSVTATYSGGCISTDQITIGFIPIPSISASQCITAGSSANLAVTFNPALPSGANPTYSWTGPNSFTSNAPSPSISSFSAANAGLYNLMLSVNPGQGTNCNFNLTSNLFLTPTQPNFTVPATGCQGTNYTPTGFTAQANTTYSWTITPTSSSTGLNSATPVFNFTNAGSYVIGVTATQNGCSSTAPNQGISILNLTNVLPSIDGSSGSQVINGVPTFAICSGGSTSTALIFNENIGGSNPANTSYTYSINGSAPAVFGSSIQAAINYGNNTLITTNTSGVCSIIDTINIYSGSNPYVSLGANNSINLCPGSTVNFVIDPTQSIGVTNPPGTTYTLFFSDVTGNTTYTDLQNDLTVPHTFNTTSCGVTNTGTASGFPNNTFYALVTAQNPCGTSQSFYSPITVHNLPDADFTISDSTICEGQTATVTNTGTAGSVVGSNSPYNCTAQGKFYWVISPGTLGVDYTLAAGQQLGSLCSPSTTPPCSWSNTASNGSSTLNVTFLTPGSYSITQVFYNQCGQSTYTRNICVISPPSCQFTASPNPGCSPLTVNINNTTVAPTCGGTAIPLTYAWTITAPSGTTTSYTSNSSQAPPPLILTNPTSTPQDFTISLVVSPKDPYNPSQNFGSPNCSSNCTQIVTVNPIPVFTPFNITSCTSPYQANINLQTSTNMPSSFSWVATANNNVLGESTSAQASSTITDNLSNQTSSFQTINYAVTPTSSLGCLGATGFSTVTINTIAPGTISANQTVCSGGDPVLLTGTTPAGFGTLSYQWQASTDNNTWTNITGATNANYDPPSTANTIYYRRVVSYVSNSVTCSSISNVVTITVNTLTAGTIGNPQNICAGDDPVALSVLTAASAAGTLTYQWQASTVSSSTGFTNMTNQTGTSYDPPVLNATTWYQLIVGSTLNGVSCYMSTPVIAITVFSLNPGVVSANQSICSGGDPVAFTQTTAATASSGTLSYQWQSSPDNINWTAISGATSTTFNPPILSTTTYYRRIVMVYSGTTLICQAYSNVLTVDVLPDPTFTVQPTPAQTICTGGTIAPLSFTLTGGSGTATYQWYSVNNGTYTAINTNGTNNTYSPPAFNAVGTFNYAVVVTQSVSGCASGYSANAEISVVADPSVSISTGASYCQNASPVAPLTVTASAGASTNYLYQWYNGANPISGATSNSFTPSVANTGTFNYTCQVSSNPITSGCAMTTTQATITVTSGPSITSQPQSQSICVGGTLSNLNVAYLGGTGTVTYQWFSNTSNNTTGGTAVGSSSSSFTLPSTLNATAGTSYYYCQLSFGGSGGCSQISTAVAAIDVVANPTVSAPISQTICTGGSPVAMSVSASGGVNSSYAYQWYNASGIISTATSAAYTPPSSVGSYYCVVSILPPTTGCSVTSANATITVEPDPTVTAPQSASYCQNASPITALTVTASSGASSNYSYQWFNGATSINGATSNTYTPSVTTTGTINYTCQVTIAPAAIGCSTTSNPATITVTAGPTFTAQPQSQTICVGGTLTALNVAYAGGSGTASYQWYSNTTNANTGGTVLSSETNASLNLPSTLNSTAANSYYYCVINFGSGSGCSLITSDVAIISVLTDPTFSVQPAPTQTICTGGTIAPLAFTLSGGSGTATYQWYTVSNGTYTAINTNATNSTYSPPAFNAVGTFNYAVLVSQSVSGCASGYSANAEVSVVADPSVSISTGASYCQNASPVTPLTVTAAAGISNNYVYQWYSGSNPISGATSSSYTPSVANTGIINYTCQVSIDPTTSGCAMTTIPTTITVNAAPTFATQPLSTQTICLDGTFNPLTVATQNGAGTPTFQWYSNTANSTANGTILTGETNSSFTPPSNVVGTVYYYCVATFASGGCSSITSTIGIANVVADPIISIEPIPSQSICVGGTIGTPLTAAATGGTGTTAYQWSHSAGAIAGATSQNFTPPIFSTVGTYSYFVSVSLNGSGCNNAVSQNAQIEVVADPTVTTQPLDAEYCQNASPVTPLTVTATGGLGAFSYQWYSNTSNSNSGGTLIIGATTSAFIPLVNTIGVNYYYCVISQTGLNCSVTSVAAAITVNSAPTFSTPALPTQTICLDGNFNALTVATQNGTGNPTYQWFSNPTNTTSNGTLISGATNSTYTPPSNVVGATYYYCVATFASGGCSAITSTVATAIVLADPVISAQPIASQSICVGGTISLALTAASTGGTGAATYQWSTASGPITGANSQTFLPPAFSAVGQYSYSVTITFSGSGCNALTTQNALIDVVADPIVSTQPVSAAYCQNGSPVAPLTVSASGGVNSNYQYQWFNGGTPITGAITNTYNPSVTATGTINYTCQVSIDPSAIGCSITSNAATIQVNPAPTFSTPALPTQTICLDGNFNALNLATLNGTGTPTFQWFSNTANSTSNGTPIVGATNDTYTPPSNVVGTVYYYCVASFASGGCSAITSTVATAIVVADPVISAQPLASQSICIGGTISLALTAASTGGTGATTYQWSTASGPITGANSQTFLPPAFSAVGQYSYSVTITLSGSGCNALTTQNAIIDVIADPIISTQPVSAAYCQNGSPVTPLFVVASGGLGTYAYQWYSNTSNSNAGGTLISGATSSTYTPAVTAIGTIYYYCSVTQTGLNCNVSSNTAAIVVNQAPVFIDQPSSQTICIGGAFTPLSVTYQFGTGVPSYQWYSNSVNSYSGAVAISGATNPSFQPDASTVSNNYYFCEIAFSFGGCTSISSLISNQIVVNDPVIVAEPLANQTICVGGTIPNALQVNVSGGTGTTTYQWFAGSNAVSGATQNSFVPSIYNNPGNYNYTVNICSSGVGCAALTSQVATIDVLADPLVSAPLSATYCQNATPIAALEVNVSGGAGTNAFQWYAATTNTTTAGSAISNATTSSFTPPVTTVGTVYYYCIVTQSTPNCANTSLNAPIQVNIPPTISAQPISTQTLCEGGSPTPLQIAYINGTNSATYQWYSNNVNSNAGGTPILNETNPSYTPPSFLTGTIYYYCVITFQQGGCSSLTSISAQVTVVNDPAISVQPLASQEICQGNTINNPLTFNYTGGTGNATIAWYLDVNPPILINGITTNSYLPIPFNIADTFNYYATLTFDGVGCNVASTQLASIVVHPTPYVTNLDDTLVICNNGVLDIPLTASVTSTFQWDTPQNNLVNGESFLTQTSYSIDDSLSNTSTVPQFLTYSVTPTSFPYGCVGPDSTVVVQVQPDVILSMNQAMEICSGSPVNGILSANIPSTFNWFVSIDNPNVTGESILPSTNWLVNDVLVNTSNMNQVVVYSVFPVSIQGTCPGLAQPLVVTVKPPIDLINPDTLTICSGSNVGINLVANTNVQFNWYATPSLNVLNETTSVVSSASINDILVNPTNAVEIVTYNVIGTSTANGCSSPVLPLYVVVNPIPSLVNLNPLTICNGNYLYPYSLQTTVTGATTNWSVLNNPIGIPSTFGSNTLPGFIATNNTVVTQTGEIQITPIFTNNNVSCFGQDTTLLIPVLPTPNVNSIADIEVCNQVQVPLTPVTGTVPNTTFEWINSNIGVGLNASGFGDIPIFIGLNSGTAPLSGTVSITPSYTQNNVTCQGTPIDFDITVNPSPVLINSDIEICDQEFTNILLNANISSSFVWNAQIQPNVYNETAAPIQTSSFINDQLVLASTTQQTVTYDVTPISLPYGCYGNDTTIAVIVNPLPIVDFTVLTSILCDQTQINFQNNSVGSLDYTWTFGDGDSSFLFNPVHEYTNFGSFIVQLEAIDQITGCINNDTQVLSINESPEADFILSDSLACGSLDVVFNALDLNPSWQYFWNFGDGSTSNQFGVAGHQFGSSGCFDVSLEITTPAGCISDTTQFDAVCIYPEPIAAFTVDDPVVSSLAPVVQFFNSSLYADTYFWNFGDGTSSITENPNHLFPSDPATYTIVLTASNQIGCQDTAALSLTVWQDLAIYVPNTFTPDGDEYNQTFKPVLTEGFKKDSYHMMIFNRWGEVVFESYDLEFGWDGSYQFNEHLPVKNGFILKDMISPNGTYTWKIEVTELQSGEVRKFLGHVNLIR